MRNLVKYAVNRYKKEGLAATLESIQSVLQRKKYEVFNSGQNSEFYYQLAKQEGVDARWELMKPYLSEGGSALDVGCNAGLLTKKASKLDLFAVGIEKNPHTLEDAIEYHGKSREFGLINKSITPESVKSLPKFDYIFVLSIYHHLYKQYGEGAEDILSELIKNTEKVLIFEPASSKEEYNDQDLPFDDFDEESIVQYNKEMLHNITPNNYAIECIGSRSDGTLQERYLFAIIKED